MKSERRLHVILFLPLFLLVVSGIHAQQPPFGGSSGMGARPITSNHGTVTYSYRVFEAPNKMFGYDILLNGGLIS